MMELLISGLRITGVFLIIAFGIVFIRLEKGSFRKNLFLFFLLTLLGYFLTYWVPMGGGYPLVRVPLMLSIALPFAFWMCARALFNDDFQWSGKYWLMVIAIPILHNVLYWLNENVSGGFYANFRVLPYLVSFGFILMAIYESLKGQDNDLVLSRIKKRNVFVVFSSFLGLFSIYLFFTADPLRLPPGFDLLQTGVICIFITLFFFSQLKYQNIWERQYSVNAADEANRNINQRILKKLLQEFEEEKIYTLEGLTISLLSEQIGEKEYLVRRAINTEMDYTNFNAFLNHYRIADAMELISSNHEKQLTFQEIAFKVGYQSVATFNRAFKSETDMTPSAFLQKSILN